MTDCPNCQKLQADMDTLRKQMAIRLDRDGFIKMCATAFGANILPHRNQAPAEVAKQCFRNAHIWWEELLEYRKVHGDD
jgi:hypothetical protein